MTANTPPTVPSGSSAVFAPADVTFVIEALGRHTEESDVCRLLCEQRGMAWTDAQALVMYVQKRHATSVARRQSPYFIVLGVFTVLAGIAFVLVFGAQLTTFIADPPDSRFERRQMTNALALCGVGLLMLVGGGAGTLAVLRSLWGGR